MRFVTLLLVPMLLTSIAGCHTALPGLDDDELCAYKDHPGAVQVGYPDYDGRRISFIFQCSPEKVPITDWSVTLTLPDGTEINYRPTTGASDNRTFPLQEEVFRVDQGAVERIDHHDSAPHHVTYGVGTANFANGSTSQSDPLTGRMLFAGPRVNVSYESNDEDTVLDPLPAGQHMIKLARESLPRVSAEIQFQITSGGALRIGLISLGSGTQYESSYPDRWGWCDSC